MCVCVCVCVLALVIRHVNPIFSAPYYIVLCGLYGSTILIQIISQAAEFSGWGEINRTKNVFWFLVKLLSETFLILRRIRPDITTNIHRC